MTKEPIKIDILVEDPDLGEDGKQFHKQYEITAEEFEASPPLDDKEVLKKALEIMSDAIVTAWDDQPK